MYWLRPGSLIDIAAIAAEHTISDTARCLQVPIATLIAYVNGARYIRPAAATHYGNLFSQYIFDQGIIDYQPDSALDEYLADKRLDSLELAKEFIADNFVDAFEVEYRLRKIIEPEPWNHRFGCSAAQVLAEFEATVESKEPVFTSKDARRFLELWQTRPKTKQLLHEQVALGLQYVLWRVKTREHFIIEQFHPFCRALEVRDNRPIPLVLNNLDPLFEPDHRFYIAAGIPAEWRPAPDIPRLKLPATLDTLLLCRSVGVKANHVLSSRSFVPVYYCFCESPISNKTISFVATQFDPSDKRVVD